MLVTFRRLVSGSRIGELRITTGVVETTEHNRKTVSKEVAIIWPWRKISFYLQIYVPSGFYVFFEPIFLVCPELEHMLL
jgi:hypothetical protein